MERNEKGMMFINMFIGTLGLFLIVIGIVKYAESVGDLGYVIPLFGFSLTMTYLHYLERKAGITNKFIWIKSIISIIVMILIFSFLF